jgi:hypothetical protein
MFWCILSHQQGDEYKTIYNYITIICLYITVAATDVISVRVFCYLLLLLIVYIDVILMTIKTKQCMNKNIIHTDKAEH